MFRPWLLRGAPPLHHGVARSPERRRVREVASSCPFLASDSISMEPLHAPTANSPKACVTFYIQGGSLERRLVPVFRIRGHFHHCQASPTVPPPPA